MFNIAALFQEVENSEAMYHKVNVDGTLKLLKAAGAAGVKRFVHCSTVGIDVSSTMIEEAKKKASAAGLNQIEFIHANWEQLDPDFFKAYKFKVIFCANAFHYFADPQSATNQLFKQLVEGGTLYVLERNKALSPLTFLWGGIHKVFIKDQVLFYKTSELVSFFERASFKHIKILSSIKKYFWKNKLFTSIVLIEGRK